MALQNTGTITIAADTAVTTSISGAAFADGSTLSGSWTAIYDGSGNFQAVENATFTLTNTAGVSTTFTGAGATLTKTGTGTYSLTAATPATLTAELQGLTFTPTKGQVAQGSMFPTKFDLSINDGDGSASAPTTDTVSALCRPAA